METARRRTVSEARCSIWRVPHSALARKKKRVTRFRKRISRRAIDRKSRASRRKVRGTGPAELTKPDPSKNSHRVRAPGAPPPRPPSLLRRGQGMAADCPRTQHTDERDSLSAAEVVQESCGLGPERAVTTHEIVAKEKSGDRTERQEHPEGKAHLAISPFRRNQGETHEAPGYGRKQDRHDDAGRPQESSDHAEHLDVSQSHPLVTRDPLVEESDEEAPSRPEHGAHQSGERRTGRRAKREQEAHQKTGECDAVRQDLELGVDREQGQTGGAEERSACELGPLSRAQGDEDPQDTVDELEHEIPDRDRRPADTASTAKDEPGQDGHVVERAHRRSTGGTVRRRRHDRLPPWKPVDKDVQETADRQTKEAGRDGQDRAVTLKGRDHKRLRAFAGRAKSRTAASVRADRTEIAPPMSTDRGR